MSPDIPVGSDLVVPLSNVRSNRFLLENEIPPEKRRECEYEIFQSVEEVMKLPIIRLVVPEGLRHACPGAEVSETRDLDENTMIDLDQKGQICAITWNMPVNARIFPIFPLNRFPLQLWPKLDIVNTSFFFR